MQSFEVNDDVEVDGDVEMTDADTVSESGSVTFRHPRPAVFIIPDDCTDPVGYLMANHPICTAISANAANRRAEFLSQAKPHRMRPYQRRMVDETVSWWRRCKLEEEQPVGEKAEARNEAVAIMPTNTGKSLFLLASALETDGLPWFISVDRKGLVRDFLALKDLEYYGFQDMDQEDMDFFHDFVAVEFTAAHDAALTSLGKELCNSPATDAMVRRYFGDKAPLRQLLRARVSMCTPHKVNSTLKSVDFPMSAYSTLALDEGDRSIGGKKFSRILDRASEAGLRLLFASATGLKRLSQNRTIPDRNTFEVQWMEMESRGDCKILLHYLWLAFLQQPGGVHGPGVLDREQPGVQKSQDYWKKFFIFALRTWTELKKKLVKYGVKNPRCLFAIGSTTSQGDNVQLAGFRDALQHLQISPERVWVVYSSKGDVPEDWGMRKDAGEECPEGCDLVLDKKTVDR